jgi:ribosomal protein S21
MRNKFNINETGHGNFTVYVRKNESTEDLIRRFLMKTKKEKILDELLERKQFKKPSAKERERRFKSQLILKKLREKERAELRLLDE